MTSSARHNLNPDRDTPCHRHTFIFVMIWNLLWCHEFHRHNTPTCPTSDNQLHVPQCHPSRQTSTSGLRHGLKTASGLFLRQMLFDWQATYGRAAWHSRWRTWSLCKDIARFIKERLHRGKKDIARWSGFHSVTRQAAELLSRRDGVLLCSPSIFDSAAWRGSRVAGRGCLTDIATWARASSAAARRPPSSSRRSWRRNGPLCSPRIGDCRPCGARAALRRYAVLVRCSSLRTNRD